MKFGARKALQFLLLLIVTWVVSVDAGNADEPSTSVEVIAPGSAFDMLESVGKGAGVSVQAIVKDSFSGLEILCNETDLEKDRVVLTTIPITSRASDICVKNGITHLIEAQLGYFAFALFQKRSDPTMELDSATVFKALAREVPSDQRFVPNASVKWSDVSTSLPDLPIGVLLPSGTPLRRLFDIEVLIDGCRKFELIQSIFNAKSREDHCTTVREDVVREIVDGQTRLDAMRSSPPGTVSIFSIMITEKNKDWLRTIPFNGYEPTLQDVNVENYTLSIPIYVYANSDSVFRGGVESNSKRFIKEILSEAAIGENGYLMQRGLMMLPSATRDWQRRSIN
jgi:phosphate transport system substrate-binding protein